MEVIQCAGPSHTLGGPPQDRSWQWLTPATSIPSSPAILGSPLALFPVPWWVSYKKARQNKATLDVNSSVSVTFMVVVQLLSRVQLSQSLLLHLE